MDGKKKERGAADAAQAAARRSRIQLYVGLFVMLLVAAFAANAYQTATLAKKGREMAAPEGETVRIEVQGYAQGDPRWANVAMGDGGRTIGTDGGLLCCIASALDGLGHGMTPDALNGVFVEKGVYDADGGIKPTRIGEAVPGIEGKAPTAFKREDVDAYLATGRTPIVKVKESGGAVRYVLVVGMEKGEYIAMDPATGETVPLSRYDRKAYGMIVLL